MFKQRLKLMDKWIAIPYFFLTIFSIIMVYSASSFSAMADYDDPNYYLVRQSLVVAISLFAAFIVYFFPFRILKKKRTIQLGTLITFAILIIVLFLPPVLGARRWIPLPIFNIQPAEFAKVFVIWYLAYIFSRNQKELVSEFFQTIMRPSILVAMIVFLVLIEPDTGTAIIIAGMTVVMLSASGASLKYGFTFIVLGVVLAGGLTFAVYRFGEHIPILSYRYDRFLGLWDPFGYYETFGNQLVNSYYALSRGGIFGVGIGNSVQKTGYLPFPYTDFIIAIVGEELGLLGVSVVLIALGTMIGRSFYLGAQSKSSFNSLIYIGVGSMLLVQSLINLAGLTGIIPISGVTFPLLSYGGSSFLVVSISLALVANASTQDKLKQQKE